VGFPSSNPSEIHFVFSFWFFSLVGPFWFSGQWNPVPPTNTPGCVTSWFRSPPTRAILPIFSKESDFSLMWIESVLPAKPLDTDPFLTHSPLPRFSFEPLERWTLAPQPCLDACFWRFFLAQTGTDLIFFLLPQREYPPPASLLFFFSSPCFFFFFKDLLCDFPETSKCPIFLQVLPPWACPPGSLFHPKPSILGCRPFSLDEGCPPIFGCFPPPVSAFFYFNFEGWPPPVLFPICHNPPESFNRS